jgi:hypothetical protein
MTKSRVYLLQVNWAQEDWYIESADTFSTNFQMHLLLFSVSIYASSPSLLLLKFHVMYGCHYHLVRIQSKMSHKFSKILQKGHMQPFFIISIWVS